ncbi:PAS domain-containing protein [Vibrio fortis]|uniref:PAS domain-containing protein n=1 Tax=Vibrio fortis TaxID=212667 RepID=UPI0021C4B565|nr:PAS domain-containing protein [Vibrio fortis]
MNSITSIRHSLRFTVVVNCLVVTWVACIIATITLELEREYWKTGLVSQYQDLAMTHISNEFGLLKSSTERLLENESLQRFVQSQEQRKRTFAISEQFLKSSLASSIIVQDRMGRITHLDSEMNASFIKAFRELHEPDQQMIFSSSSKLGIDFVDGRIFMFASVSVLDEHQRRPVGLVTVLQEVNADMLKRMSKSIGRSFSFHYTAAGMRLTQVSYDQGYHVAVDKVIQEQGTGFRAEYRVTMADGRVQPANFVITFDARSYDFIDPRYVLLGLVFGIPIVSLLLWIVFSRKVVKPVSHLIDYITDESTYAREQDDKLSMEELPEEMKLIYSRFKKVYINMARQNQFSQVLVGAIGDIIITVDKDGQICYANPAAREWFGVEDKLLIGQPLELFTSNINHETPDVATWLYTCNVKKKRLMCRAELVNIISKTYIYPSDVIVQPIDSEVSAEDVSTSVVVIRVKDTVPVSEYMVS